MTVTSEYGNNIDDFEIIEEIGRGGFAQVFKAKSLLFDRDTCANVAIKRISKEHIRKKNCEDRIRREIEIHSRLPRHFSCIQFYKAFEDEKYWYLVLELITGGSLEEYIKRKGCLHEKEAVQLINEVIQGVKFLHERLIIHRDLSLRNLLLTEDHEVKIADFGLAVKLNRYDEKTNTVLGTPNFMPPEAKNKEYYDFKFDCWSIGCVLYTLLYGEIPFKNKKKGYKLTFPENASQEAKALLRDMLKTNQEERIDLESAEKYEIFYKYGMFKKQTKNTYKRNGDSGLNSLSRSGSMNSLSMKKTCKMYEPKTVYCKSGKEEKNKESRYFPPTNMSQNNDVHNTRYLDQNSTNCSGFVNQIRPKIQTIPSRLQSPLEDQTKSCLKSPKYPAELQMSNRYLNSHVRSSGYNSQNQYGLSSFTASFEGNTVNYSSYSSNCYSRQQPLSHCLEESPSVIEKRLKDIVSPLNTERLLSYRKESLEHSAVISILSDGQVCVECLKLKKNEKYVSRVYFISPDGSKIIFYNLKKKIPLNSEEPPRLSDIKSSIQHYTFENLPKIHWNKYKLAKRFVDANRSVTPKVINYGVYGKCVMMENSPNPNFQMNFYNDYKIFESRQKRVITDNEGCIVDKISDKLLEEFEELKVECKQVEEYFITALKSKFPVKIGMKRDVSKISTNENNYKENVTPSHVPSSLNETDSNKKPYTVTVKIKDDPFQNSSQRNISTPQPSQGSMISPKSTLSQLKSVTVEGGYITAEYKDGIELCISEERVDKFTFRNSRTKECVYGYRYPHLMDRYENDSRYIIKQALSIKGSRKTYT